MLGHNHNNCLYTVESRQLKSRYLKKIDKQLKIISYFDEMLG